MQSWCQPGLVKKWFDFNGLRVVIRKNPESNAFALIQL